MKKYFIWVVGDYINKATITDVSKLAGVSIATVSRVINGNYPVKEQTREKVQKAIEELNFIPNDIAVSMIRKKTNTIGVIVPSITNIFFSTLVKGVTEILEVGGYTVLLSISQHNEKDLVEKFISRRVDAIIVADSNLEDKIEFYSKIDKMMPLLFVNAYNNNFNYVSCNQENGMTEAIKHLKNKGHKNILFVRGCENSYSYNLKEKIYLDIVGNKKIISVDYGNKDDAILNTKEYIKNFFASDRTYTSVITSNDLMAIGAVEGLKELGIVVPDEVEIIGFDNIYICTLVTPNLSTVSQEIYELGKNASYKILEIIEQKCRVNLLLDSKLILRQSTT